MKFPNFRFLVLLLLFSIPACRSGSGPTGFEQSEKIEIDLSRLDDAGLRGPADGKVAVAYEFAIPDTPECRAEVRRIDPSVSFMAGSPGRVGAGPGECLCIGSTAGRDYRQVLRALADLPYIERIIECHFE